MGLFHLINNMICYKKDNITSFEIKNQFSTLILHILVQIVMVFFCREPYGSVVV